MADAAGPILIIGGHEDKEGDRLILKEIARRVDGGKLVIATVASSEPEGYFEAYQEAFSDLGVTDLVVGFRKAYEAATPPLEKKL